VYPWVRPSQQLFGGGVMAWDDRGHLPWDCLVWDYSWNTPMPELGDLRDITFPTGIRVRCLEPLTRYHIAYARPGCELDLVYEALMEPHVIGHGDDDGLYTAHFDQPGHVTGLGVSPGVTEGRARVVADPSTDDIEPGEILVCETTDPSWAAYFLVAAGVVNDIGSAMSHGSIVAREVGIPCVTNTRNGTRVLRTGDLVRVDGVAGTVDVLSRAAS
jgi:phosphohistidine swiveling domain-containing protein